MCTSAPARGQGGFSLVELVIAMVVIGVGLAALVAVLSVSVKGSADPMVRKQALTIAEGMLNEVASKPFANPANGFTGAATQANRALFDDVLDYHGYSSSGAYAIEGMAPIAGLAAYNVSVSVAGAALGGGALQAAATTESLLITVTVTYPGGDTVSLSGYRLNYG